MPIHSFGSHTGASGVARSREVPTAPDADIVQPVAGNLNRGLFTASWSGQWVVNAPVTYPLTDCSLDRNTGRGAMIPPTLNHLAKKQMVVNKPVLLQGRPETLGTNTLGAKRRAANEGRPLPLCITLPATVCVSLALWAGLIMAVRALL